MKGDGDGGKEGGKKVPDAHVETRSMASYPRNKGEDVTNFLVQDQTSVVRLESS